MHYDEQDQANAREQRGYDFQMKRDEQNFGQQKELAKMGYNQEERMSSINYNQDMAKLGMQQSYNTQQNATAQQNEMIKAAMTQGLSYEDAKARVMGTTSGVGGDLRWLASQYPGEAWAKNNNPTGIKSAISERTKQLMKDAWVQWTTGSNPPPNESGTYMQFATIEDGLKAHAVLLTQASYPNVYDRLKQWVGTGEWDNYAKQVMEMAWLPVDKNLRFDALKPEQMDALLSAHIKKESPWLYKYLQTAPTTPTTPTTQITGYKINGKSFNESDVEVLAEIRDVFTKNATEWKKLLKENGYDVKDIAALNNDKLPKTGTQKKWARDIMYQIQDIAKMDWNDATGLAAWLPSFSGWDAETANTKIEAIISKLALPNLGLLKWPMSDKDLAFISSASANLKPTQSDESFEKRLLEYYNWNAGISWLKKAETLKDIQDANIYGVIPEWSQSNAPVDNRFSELYSQLK